MPWQRDRRAARELLCHFGLGRGSPQRDANGFLILTLAAATRGAVSVATKVSTAATVSGAAAVSSAAVVREHSSVSPASAVRRASEVSSGTRARTVILFVRRPPPLSRAIRFNSSKRRRAAKMVRGDSPVVRERSRTLADIQGPDELATRRQRSIKRSSTGLVSKRSDGRTSVRIRKYKLVFIVVRRGAPAVAELHGLPVLLCNICAQAHLPFHPAVSTVDESTNRRGEFAGTF